MSYFDDHEDWVIYGGAHGHAPSTPPTCKFCGATDLDWVHTGVRWRLYNAAGEIHVCERRASLDDFPND